MNQTDAKIEVLAELLFDLCRERAELLGKAVMQLEDLAAARIHLGVRIGVER